MNACNALRQTSPRFHWKALVLSLLVALSAAFLFSAPLQAQGGPEDGYVDLVMTYEYDEEDVAYSVQNNGTATAAGVTVSFRIKDLEAGAFTGSFVAGTQINPTITNKMDEDGTNQTFTWEIGTIPAGETSAQLIFSTRLHPGHRAAADAVNNWPGMFGVITARVSSLPSEPDFLLANNEIKIYSFAEQSTGTTLHMDGSRLALLLSVSNLRPAAGGAVNFGLTAENLNVELGIAEDYINLIDEIEIEVELSDGLEFNWQSAVPADFAIDSVNRQSGTWEPEGVDAIFPDDQTNNLSAFLDSRNISIPTQLTSDPSLAEIPLEERCITAWVEDSIPPPSPDYALGRLTQCLGDDPPLLFTEGSIGILTPFPCNGDVNHICRDQNNDNTSDSQVVVAAVVPQYDEDVDLGVTRDQIQSNLRSQGVGRTDEAFRGISDANFFLPENVVIQVKDPEGRVNDTYSHSLIASGPSWQTGRRTTGRIDESGAANRSVSGVLVTHTRKPFNSHTSNWTSMDRKLSVTYKNGDPVSGGIKLRSNSTGRTFLTTAPQNTRTTTSLSSSSIVPYFIEFPTLGTYTVGFIVDVTHTDGNVYSDTGRYTFHVGPIAELEARDVGQNPALPAGQRAYTIMAVNNGPDTAPAAKMTLTDLDADSCAGDATKGFIAFVGGECAWTIGELLTKDISQASRGRDGEVLTIITSDDVDAGITANITNNQDYAVCIDSSGEDVDATSDSCSSPNTWHTAKYYDYISGNDSANIKAREATGADLPSLQSAQAETAAIVVSWEPVTEVNGRTVTHYQVQRETNPWVTVADNVPAGTTKYVDTDVTAGETYRYQVRAVNDRDQEGPWSVPIEGTATMMEPEVITRTETVFRDRVVTETETITVGENPFAYFADEETTRTVAENSAPGSPVGAPVTVIRNSGNKVVYSLEGPDAALFTIEEDTGQILVGEGALLDFESGTTSYTVEVVADPRSGADVRTTVTITVVDIAETGFVFIDPPGAPLVGAPLFASLMHTEGEPVEPRWQWQRSMPDGAWADIPGAIQETYTPSDLDAGRRLRALVVFGNPLGDGEGLAGAVTERLPGEAQEIPTAGTGAPPEEVFGVLGHSLAAAWLYDNATQTWAVYSPWNAPELNDLKTVSRNDVVWMDIISEVQFQGNTLYPGWNQVIVN